MQKQLPDLLCKRDAFKKIRNIHLKTPVLVFIFNKIAGLKVWNLLKRDLKQVLYYKLSKNLNNYFGKHLRTTDFRCVNIVHSGK